MNACGQQRGGCVAAVGDHPRRGPGRRGRGVAAVDGDVEAGLVKLLFDIDLAGGLQRQEPGAHPGKLRKGHALLADVDGGAGEVRGGNVAVGGGGVAVDCKERALELDGADGGVDLEGAMETRIVAAGEVGEEVGRPWAAVAAVEGQIGIHAQGIAGGDGNDVSGGLELVELGVVFDADQTLGFIALVLAHEGFERSTQRRNEVNAGDGFNGGMGCDGLRREVRGVGVGSEGRVTGDGGRRGEDCVRGVAGDGAAMRSCYAAEMGAMTVMDRSWVADG